MEVKVKLGEYMLDATIEMVDGVMVVSPKEVKEDITKFKDGDVITCEWDDGNQRYNWTGILQGEIECISGNMFIGDYCSIDCKGEILEHSSGPDSAARVRYATEEEKKKLFDELAEEGYEFDFEKKKLVKLKWKPKEGEVFWSPVYFSCRHGFKPITSLRNKGQYKAILDKGWCFKTEEECQEFCNRLNDAINQVKP